jgi:glycerophosphoryl diester phosphodiesterase
MFKKEKPPISSFDFTKIQPLKNAFAHNDEQFNFPLLGSLKLGFNYIEADIHLIKNKIYVSHRKPFFPKNNNTLTKLYLEPLLYFFQKNNSTIFQNPKTTFNLVLDIKTDAEATYEILKKQIEPFHSMLFNLENRIGKKNPIKILLSGNRPVNSVLSKQKKSMCLDGRMQDLKKNYSSNLMPIISENYSKIFGYTFFSKIPAEKKMDHFRKIANEIHAQNKLFRLWNIPENEHVWTLLLKNGLDIISTDRIEKLSSFLGETV